MLSRFAFAVALCAGFVQLASAQVVRFETTMGDFDMVLNPTNNAKLQGHVDNMLAYVEGNNYLGSWINRADTGFVLQMGGFFSHTKRPPILMDSISSVQSFAPIQGEPASENPGLSNTVGTVAMALSGLPTGGTNQNSGTSSFFVNLTSNDFLDADFTVFAMIPDMTVINAIMALPTIDRTTDPIFGAGDGNLAFSDVAIQSNGSQVFIKRAFVINDTLATAKAMAGIQSVLQESQAAAGSGTSLEVPQNVINTSVGGGASLGANVVPEPATIAMLFASLVGFGFTRRRRS